MAWIPGFERHMIPGVSGAVPSALASGMVKFDWPEASAKYGIPPARYESVVTPSILFIPAMPDASAILPVYDVNVEDLYSMMVEGKGQNGGE